MAKTLFNSMSWLNESVDDHIDEYLESQEKTREDFRDEEELREAVGEYLQDNTQCEWEYFQEQCGKEKEHHCLVTGYFMAWNGPREGGKVFKNLETAVSNIIMDGDSSPVFSITDDGVLVLDETHHDAPCSGNHYEFKILTATGEKYYEKHINDDRRTLCEALKLHKRSRNVNIKIFGFKTLEEVK